ncbi:TetR/AcrR family transcriptional regulator [Pararhizobium gei]|uniref:TetR/AcrR family transcriptional regulator n=1 Tax=Pararhizobium gei TaxID=1395951 RepID=UPI0023DB8AFF|nr:TetR/AcrR family transcriptional regulator [Rhizobium gei]
MRRSNSERTQAMRAALIEAARTHFVEKGYAETATPDIVTAAGVTRGALYHHFEDKKTLFASVIAEEAKAVRRDIENAAMTSPSAYDALLDGMRGYFDAMAKPGRTRLLLLDGPAILGPAEMRRMDEAQSEHSLHRGLKAYLTEKDASQTSLGIFTELLSAAFDRAALAIEAGRDRAAYEKAIATMIEGIALK